MELIRFIKLNVCNSSDTQVFLEVLEAPPFDQLPANIINALW